MANFIYIFEFIVCIKLSIDEWIRSEWESFQKEQQDSYERNVYEMDEKDLHDLELDILEKNASSAPSSSMHCDSHVCMLRISHNNTSFSFEDFIELAKMDDHCSICGYRIDWPEIEFNEESLQVLSRIMDFHVNHRYEESYHGV